MTDSSRLFNGEHEIHSEPRYDLSEHERGQLTRRLLREREPTTSDKVICYKIDSNEEYANIARTVELEVFEKYFKNTVDDMHYEYGPYESQSIFFLSVDQETGQPAGVLRAIKYGASGLKTFRDLESPREAGQEERPFVPTERAMMQHGIESLEDCWDVGTVAVRKQYRGDNTTSIQLYRALYVSAMEENIGHFVSIIDVRPLSKMTKGLGMPFVPLGGSKPFAYIGSELSQAVYGSVSDAFEVMSRRRRWSPVKRILGRTAFNQLIKGSHDSALQL